MFSDTAILNREDSLETHFLSVKLLIKTYLSTIYICVEKDTGKKVVSKAIMNDNVESMKKELNFLMKVKSNKYFLEDVKGIIYQNVPVIQMEYLEFEDLKQFTKSDNLMKFNNFIRISKELMEGLEYLKRCNIVHRDIKPENILCTSRSEDSVSIKIIDFGIAENYFISNGNLSTQSGTPGFWSPETLMEQHQSFSSDMWSMGIVMFLLLTSLHPIKDCVFDFDGDEEDRMMNARYISLSDVYFYQLSTKPEDVFKINNVYPIFKNIFILDPSSRYNPDKIVEDLEKLCFDNV